MSGKFALIIGNTEYTDPGLAQLTAPGKDAEDFARVLQEKELCAFDNVSVLLNQPSFTINEAVEDFFDQKKPDDLLVLYFSGHGVRDELGALYLAVKNTNRFRLRSTAVKSDFIREAMDQSRSKRQVLILDCCNSGAFAQGTKAATGVSIGTASAFEAGYGRIILTASDSTQFAWEGDKVIGETDNSLFTHYLVEGLQGEADRDGDGHITVDELYDYAYERVKFATPKQTPSKFSSKQQGEIILRDNIRVEDTRPVPLPDDLVAAIKSSLTFVREGAVRQLEDLLRSRNLGLTRSARQALEKIAEEDDSRSVSRAAARALEAIRQNEKASKQKQSVQADKSEADQPKATQEAVSQRSLDEPVVAAGSQDRVLVEKRTAEKSLIEKSAEPRAEFIYVIEAGGTPLHNALPASGNWSVWLKKGSKLIMITPDKSRESIGKHGHYIEVSDTQGKYGYVAAHDVGLTKETVKEQNRGNDQSNSRVTQFPPVSPIKRPVSITTGLFVLLAVSVIIFIAQANAARDAAVKEAQATAIVKAQFTQTAIARTQNTTNGQSIVTENAKATDTAIARVTSTAIAQVTSTARAMNYGPVSGSLDHNADDSLIEIDDADVNIRDFVVSGIFHNPYSISTGSWDYGFLFRWSDTSHQYRIIITSDKVWRLLVRHDDSTSVTVQKGELPNLDISENGSNDVVLYSLGKTGILFVNGEFISELNLSTHNGSGDVGIATGLYSGNQINGSTTEYEAFQISALQLSYEPVSGSLDHNADDSLIEIDDADVNIRDFVVSGIFHNPYSISTGSWDYGFLFRWSDTSHQYRIIITSDKVWRLLVRHDDSTSVTVQKGELPNLDISENGSNDVVLYSLDKTGILFVNGEFISELNLSTHNGSGDVGIATGLYSGNQINGSTTEYEGFSIWEVP